ncbi:hypothetical protein [Streptomyces shenzhenensis]|uniref:hypothetical protein n=1 Tax=Streptomyces shenzhenensis TaxID=943815 RepID=UPI001F18AF33|nr:hypothetical protein [Streptomyces shenzhenensis]
MVSQQEMEAEATTEEVVHFLASLAASAAPERAAAEHLAVARFGLRELLNDGQDGEDFDVSYSDYREGHSRVTLSLRLLEEGIGRAGSRHRAEARSHPTADGQEFKNADGRGVADSAASS